MTNLTCVLFVSAVQVVHYALLSFSDLLNATPAGFVGVILNFLGAATMLLGNTIVRSPFHPICLRFAVLGFAISAAFHAVRDVRAWQCVMQVIDDKRWLLGIFSTHPFPINNPFSCLTRQLFSHATWAVAVRAVLWLACAFFSLLVVFLFVSQSLVMAIQEVTSFSPNYNLSK